MSTRVNVKCKGDNGTLNIAKLPGTIVFGTSGNCKFTSFKFVPVEPAPGFSNRQPASGGGPTISYDYDGSPIPPTGDKFDYATDEPILGNGTGVIKN